VNGPRPASVRAAHAAWACGVIAFACAGSPARADDAWAPATTRLSIEALSGSAMPDAALADYQWATLPRAAWGAQALAVRGPVEAGLRLWRTRTQQDNDLPGGTLSNTVHLTSLEAVARARLVRALGVDVMGSTSVGRLRVAWDPDRVMVDAGGTPVEVRFEPVNEWIAGAGFALTRPVAPGWRAGVELERRVFRMNTAHRNGSTIEYRRETFGDWNARVALAWQYGTR